MSYPITSAISYTFSDFQTLNKRLCHSGITLLVHFVRSNDLLVPTKAKAVTNHCHICATIKPQFYHPLYNSIVKATQPLE